MAARARALVGIPFRLHGREGDARVVVRGASVSPPTPVHLTRTLAADGGARVRWVRRSRSGWRWADGVDVPLSEEIEAYRVTVTDGDGRATSMDVDRASVTLGAATLGQGPVRVEVRQRGTFGESMPAVIEWEEEPS